MKRFMTALATCAFLLMGNAANANLRTWDHGGGNDNWSTALNWAPNFVPATNDDITITLSGTTSIFDSSANASPYGAFIVGNNTSQVTFHVDREAITFTSTNIRGLWAHAGSYNISAGPITLNPVAADFSATVTVNSDLTLTGSTLTIDADTAGYDRVLTKAGAGSLTVTNSTTVKADADADNPATFTLSAGTFDPAALYLYGGSTSARQAIFHLDGGTLTKPDSTILRSYVEFNLAAGTTANFGNTRCDADATVQVIDNSTGVCQTDEFKVQQASDTAISVTKTGDGKLDCGSLVITGSASNGATVTVSAGSVVTR